MQFTYDRDSLMFNVTVRRFFKSFFTHMVLLLTCFRFKSLPKCEYLRYLTAKLGQYLNVGSIEIIPLERVTARFVVDLNLPSNLA